jgi:hypothetical protein
MLLEGPEAATEAVLHALRAHCHEPVRDWDDALGDERPRTLIVRDVAALPATEQQRLLRWIVMGQRSQIISTTAQPLFPLVERDLFLVDLFYQLNVFRLDVREGALLEEP